MTTKKHTGDDTDVPAEATRKPADKRTPRERFMAGELSWRDLCAAEAVDAE